MFDRYFGKIKEALKPIFVRELMMIKFRKAYFDITFIQKRMTMQMQTKMSKVDVLDTYWDKILGPIQMQASKLRDRNMS